MNSNGKKLTKSDIIKFIKISNYPKYSNKESYL